MHLSINSTLRVFFVACVVLLAPVPASALIVDFGDAGAGNLGGSYQSGPVTVEAFALSGLFYTQSTLFGHPTGSGQAGLGVCSEPCIASDFTGEVNSNDRPLSSPVRELIRLRLDPGWRWSSVSVSALESALLGGKDDSGRLFFGNSSGPIPQNLAAIATFLSSFSASGCGLCSRDVSLQGDAAVASYLYLLPDVPGIQSDLRNDFLVWRVQVVSTPEPSLVAVLGIGLAALATAARRRRTRP